MPKIKRKLRSGKELRDVIENQGLKYVMINNKIMDLYKQGKHLHKIRGADGVQVIGEEEISFDSRDLVIYIGMKFLNMIEFQGYLDEVADFLKISKKRLKLRLEKLEKIMLRMNNTTHLEKGILKVNLCKNEKGWVKQLISKKEVTGTEITGKRVKINRWYAPFDCDLKKVNVGVSDLEEYKPYNFFMITIYDYDLFLEKILDDNEFSLYLYLIKCFNLNEKVKKGIPQTASKIAENLNVKNVLLVEQRINKLVNLRVKEKYTEEDQDFPLLHITKPGNYNHKQMTRQEPSIHYYPIYNDTTLSRLNGLEPDPYPKDHGKKQEDYENKLDTVEYDNKKNYKGDDDDTDF
jgi:hypothetical protein